MNHPIVKYKNKTLFVTPCLLKDLLIYEPETGVLRWKDRGQEWFPSSHAYNIFRSRFLMKEILNISGSGYYHVGIYGHFFSAHRLIWCMTYGEWPKHQIDHINGNKLDNRIVNLRECTVSQNLCNTKTDPKGLVPFRGVYMRNDKMFIAEIHKNNKKTWLGVFETPIEAAKAYDNAALNLHGEFASLNFPEDHMRT